RRSARTAYQPSAASSDDDHDEHDDHEDEGDEHHGHGHGHGDNHSDDHGYFELTFQKDVNVAGGYQVKANGIQIKSGVEIASDVYYNQIQNHGTISGDEYTSVDLPLFTTLPPFKEASAGSENIVVNRNDSQTLAAGDYRDLTVKKHGSVILSGGVYNFRKITLKKDARLKAADNTDIRVERRVKTDKQVYIGPSDGAMITASGIVIYVTGNGEEEAFKLDEESDIFASVWVQNGKLSIDEETNATGSFWGEKVDIDKECSLTLDSYFGSTGSGLARMIAWQEPAGRGDAALPASFSLHQNYPNPFNPTTTITYDLVEDGHVKLAVYDLTGREVAAIVNDMKPAGRYSLSFDGSHLSSGTYFVVLTSNKQHETRKMTLLK
ncbi:MAG: T9SS type A sorting domain-containing protein, partial [Fidelibacterota bacterium]